MNPTREPNSDPQIPSADDSSSSETGLQGMDARDMDPTVRGPVDQEVVDELTEIAAAQDCELILIEFRGGVLRLILDRQDGGITHAHCERVARQTSAVLDVLEFGRRKYILEVSSPGLDRELFKPRDYHRFQGHLARITFDDPKDGKKKTIVGRIGQLHMNKEDNGRLELTEESLEAPGGKKAAGKGKMYAFPLSAIHVARLEVEL